METSTQDTSVPAVLEAKEATGVIVERFSEPAWLAERRRQAWDVYVAAELPSRVQHLWRYTDPAPFDLKTDQILPGATSAGSDLTLQEIVKDNLAGYAAWHDDKMVEISLDPKLAAAGVVLCDLHEAANEHASLVKTHLGSVVGTDHGKFEALNAATWQAGLFLYVPKGVVIEQPIHLITSAGSESPFFASRLLVILDEGAQLTLINEYASEQDVEISANGVIETVMGQNSNLRFVSVQRWSEKTTVLVTQRADLARDAQMLTLWAALGGGLSKVDMGSRLMGKGADVKLLGLAFGQRNQHFDHHTVHDHQSGNTLSNLDFKVVLKDSARSVYTGLIRIEQYAPVCEAYQTNRNLLLSEGARADTIPELEILTDEVRCSHGATIGPLDDDQIFYLRARGIPRDEAIRMVVNGFVEPTLAEVPEDLRDRLRSYVAERVKEI